GEGRGVPLAVGARGARRDVGRAHTHPPGGDARAFFDADAAGYDALHYAGPGSFMSERLACMLAALDRLDLRPGDPALDAGCGPGHLLAALLGRRLRVAAIDTSPAMLARAHARTGGAARLARAGIEALPFADGTFALVCTAGVLEYLPGDAAAVAELARVLRPGGHLLLPITNAWSPAGCLDFAVEALKRRRALLRAFNRAWVASGRAPVRARPFRVRRQRPAATRALVRALGLRLVADRYFHF